jgi:hypothetical protein
MSATNGTEGVSNATLLENLECPACGAGLAMWAAAAPDLSCLNPSCDHSVTLGEARELAAGWAVAVRWMEATAAVLDGEG